MSFSFCAWAFRSSLVRSCKWHSFSDSASSAKNPVWEFEEWYRAHPDCSIFFFYSFSVLIAHWESDWWKFQLSFLQFLMQPPQSIRLCPHPIPNWGNFSPGTWRHAGKWESQKGLPSSNCAMLHCNRTKVTFSSHISQSRLDPINFMGVSMTDPNCFMSLYLQD